MKTNLFALWTAAAIVLSAAPLPAEEKPADPPKKVEPKDAVRDAEKLKKEVEGFTKRLPDESGKRLWEIVTKGSDDQLKATGLKPESIEALKAERPNLKGWQEILTSEKLGRQVLKDLTDYGASSKFAKVLEDEAKQKEKKEKERERQIRMQRKEREKNRENDA